MVVDMIVDLLKILPKMLPQCEYSVMLPLPGLFVYYLWIALILSQLVVGFSEIELAMHGVAGEKLCQLGAREIRPGRGSVGNKFPGQAPSVQDSLRR